MTQLTFFFTQCIADDYNMPGQLHSIFSSSSFLRIILSNPFSAFVSCFFTFGDVLQRLLLTAMHWFQSGYRRSFNCLLLNSSSCFNALILLCLPGHLQVIFIVMTACALVYSFSALCNSSSAPSSCSRSSFNWSTSSIHCWRVPSMEEWFLPGSVAILPACFGKFFATRAGFPFYSE